MSLPGFVEPQGGFRVAEDQPQSGGLLLLARSDEYRRFAAECLKMAHATEDERNRAVLVQMAQAFFSLAEKEESHADRGTGRKDGTN
jgi:hypothetical protein